MVNRCLDLAKDLMGAAVIGMTDQLVRKSGDAPPAPREPLAPKFGSRAVGFVFRKKMDKM